jgi:phosphate transport system substrate-binding protein
MIRSTKFLLAKDGIAIIVSTANTVNNLSKNQIRDIFAGVITNWNQVGGPDKEIHVVAREEGSGTRTAFQEMVMGKDTQGKTINLVKNTILQSSNGALLQVVKGDAQAIGFISFGYLNSSVKALSIDGIAQLKPMPKAGDYPIVRPLYFVTRGQPTVVVKSFIEYCTGPEAQKLVAAEGYISVNRE